MRSILVVLLFWISPLLAWGDEAQGLEYLVQDSQRIEVQGSSRLGLKERASLSQVFKKIEALEGERVFQLLTTDLCRMNFEAEGALCDVILADTYLLKYRLVERDGRYQVVSPILLIVAN